VHSEVTTIASCFCKKKNILKTNKKKRRCNMSNKYYTELLALLEGESSAYRYPGEILERCTMAGGTDKDKVLKAFLDATQPSTLVSQEMADKTNAV
jgi:hypothetical protein